MSCLNELATVYDRIINSNQVDKPIPIYHIQNNAQVTIVIDGDGNFLRAEEVGYFNKTQRATCMPCTEESAARAGAKISAYPLFDKFEYIAGDYNDFMDIPSIKDERATKKYKKNLENNIQKHKAYLQELETWVNSKYTNKKLKSVLTYVNKNSVISDLVHENILKADVDISIQNQMTDFIRWSVEITGDNCPDLWKDTNLQDLWITYYKNIHSLKNVGFCYVLGKERPLASFHPSKIRNSGDKAKIISGNDTLNYTFRGRFVTSNQASQVSSEISQKAHNALRFLISQHGIQIGEGLTYVSWNSNNTPLPKILESSIELMVSKKNIKDREVVYTTEEDFTLDLKHAIQSYFPFTNQQSIQKIMILGLKAATTGRLSVVLYRELIQTEFIEIFENWHNGISWYYDYYNKETKKRVKTIASLALIQIVETAYGEHVKNYQIENTIERLIPCILNKKKIPDDIVKLCCASASNLLVLDGYKRENVLGIACAVFKYNSAINKKGVYKVALEKDRTSRDYLYGRLLGVADYFETIVLKERGENRETDAMRYMQRFSLYPASTWKIIYEKLTSYKIYTKKFQFYENLITEITNQFEPNDYLKENPLSGEYLLGYQCQKRNFYLYNKKEKADYSSVEVK